MPKPSIPPEMISLVETMLVALKNRVTSEVPVETDGTATRVTLGVDKIEVVVCRDVVAPLPSSARVAVIVYTTSPETLGIATLPSSRKAWVLSAVLKTIGADPYAFRCHFFPTI